MEEKSKKKYSLKFNKRIAVLLIAVIGLILLIFIVTGIIKSFNKDSNGNIYNSGLAVKSGGETYYNKYENGIIKVKGGKEYQITDETAYSINVVNDVIYYLTVSNSGTIDIRSVETNGNNLKKLQTVYTSISKIYVVGDYIYYYSNENNIYGITKINVNGSDKTVIATSNVLDFQVVNDTIYYTDNINYLYKMTLTGTNVERIEVEQPISKFQVAGKWIYFYDENEKALCRVKEDGASKSIISNLVKSDIYNVTDKKIYFFNPDKKEIASIKLNGNGYKTIVEVNINKTKINIAGDVLYYLDASDDNSGNYQMYRVKTNGSGTKAIEY